MKNIDPTASIDRRSFLKKSVIGAGAIVLPGYVIGTSQELKSPASRLNIAIIGVAGRGQVATIESMSQNVVALCDVDEDRVALARAGRNEINKQFNVALTTFEKKGARWYSDYRVMFEELADKIDAVIISTPDHMHFPIALSAINLGKHVYCEAPLSHTVEEARILAREAKARNVITQMGNQSHSNYNTAKIREWIQYGAVGEIREVHSWTSRSAIWWKNCVPDPGYSKINYGIPKSLNWEQWLGVAASRPFDPGYVPSKWRAKPDFGSGVLGDTGCHLMDAPFSALDPGVPIEIEASTVQNSCFPVPVSSHVRYEFPKRGSMPPVTWHWYEGTSCPLSTDVLENEMPIDDRYRFNGCLIIGSEGSILSDIHCKHVSVCPENRFREMNSKVSWESQEKTSGNHYAEFFNSIRTGIPASSDFNYAGPLTETVLLGAIAQRSKRFLRYDWKNERFINDEKANTLLKKEYPPGWILT